MRIIDNLDATRWAHFASEHPRGTIFHTPEITDVFLGTRGYSPIVLAAVDEQGDILALLTSVTVQTLPDPIGCFASRSIFYAEPICRDSAEGRSALRAIIGEHHRRIKRRVLFTEVRPQAAPGPEADPLIESGYDYEAYLNYLIDLSQPEQTLWRRMTNTCRANVRRAERHGVTVEEVETEEGVDTAVRILRKTYQRAQVPLADPSLFMRAFRILQPKSLFKIFLAHFEGIPVGTSVLLLYKNTVYDWYSGIQRVRSVYPSECITWHRILWGKRHGFAVYNFGGAGWPNKAYGVRDFKLKFGGDLVDHGRYRRIYSPWRFTLAEKTYDTVRKCFYSALWKTT
jgi:serine/alanine adding enzyme